MAKNHASIPFIVGEPPKPTSDVISQSELDMLGRAKLHLAEWEDVLANRLKRGATVEPGPLKFAGRPRLIIKPSA